MTFDLNNKGVDAAALVAEISIDVGRKRRRGIYDGDYIIARAERHNFMYLADCKELLGYNLNCLQCAVVVDTNGFDIEDRRPGLKGYLVIRLKTIIWNLLAFYTSRMWSQQNQANSLLISALESAYHQSETRIETLEARIAELEHIKFLGK